MILYNVTVNIDNNVREEWLSWMKNVHIPDVLKTGLFIENKIFRVMVDEESGTTYSIQYTMNSMEDLKAYQEKFAPALQKEHATKYANKFVAFRTILEQV
jgi:hypothetical protein